MLGNGCFPQFPDDGFCVTHDDDGVKEVDNFDKVSHVLRRIYSLTQPLRQI